MVNDHNSVSVIFTGDIGFDKFMTGRFNDPDLMSPALRRFFAGADHVVANVEGALISDDGGEHDTFYHAMDPGAVRALKDMHTDIWAIVNNHILDAGPAGVENTLRLALENGAKTFGAGRNIEEAAAPLLLEGAGGIGVLGCGYKPDCIPAGENTPGCLGWDDTARIAASIRFVKERCRWCVLVVHGGEEFAPMPMPYTRERFLRYLELGADIVVAHHPHVPENYELLPDGKAIFYSLGNFIFDTPYQRAQLYTENGVLLKLIFTEEGFAFEPFGTRIDRASETVTEGPLPEIFTDISAEDYEKLIPYAARAFLSAERRRMRFLEPETYCTASEAEWNAYYYGGTAEGYTPGEHMDLAVASGLAERAEEKKLPTELLPEVQGYLEAMTESFS